MIDTGTPYIVLTETAYNNFIDDIMTVNPSITCNDDDICGSANQSCLKIMDNMPDLTIVLDDNRFTLPP